MMASNQRASLRSWGFKCLLTFVCALGLVSCAGDDNDTPSDPTVARTVIVYIVAENKLNNVVASDVYEMIQGAKALTDNDCLMLYVDDIQKPRIYTIDNKTEAEDLISLVPEKEYDHDLNSTDPETLAEVLRYARSHHSADSYGIIFWSHGSGWQTLENTKMHVNDRNSNDTQLQPQLKYSFGIDNGYNKVSDHVLDRTKEEMSVIDLAKTVKQFGHVEFIMFDCCFMQTIEVAYQLKDITNYIIGAPNEIPNKGAPYDKIVPLMANNINCQDIVDAYYNHYCNTIFGSVLSVINTDGLPALASATKEVYHKYKHTMEDIDLTQVNNYFNYDNCRHKPNYCYPDFYDMNSLMKQWLNDSDYKAWKSTFDQVVVYTRATNFFYSGFPNNNSSVDVETASGVSMFLPLQKYQGDLFLNSYFLLDWAHALGIYK